MNNLYDVATGGLFAEYNYKICSSLRRLRQTAFSYRPSGLNQSLLLVAFLLDDAALGRVLEIISGRNEGTPRNEGSHLRP